MTSIFLSYARDDDEQFVRRLYQDLVSAGFDVWFDRVSMPSRSLTFHHEIRDAVAACDRLLLVVGPKAVTSDYVMQEWQFAYFAANKCVNPIVRLNGAAVDGKPMDGYELVPEELRLLHTEDFRDDARYAEHLGNLIRQLREPVAPVGKLVAVPELPPGYLPNPQRLRALRDMLLVDLREPVVVTGAAARLGLQGMAGIGKSVLANALAHHPEVQRAFRDNIFWLKLGQQPHVEELQRWLARQFGDPGHFADGHTGKETLRRLLADRAALLILDDVWNRDDAEAFNVTGPRGRLLLTTRDAGLVTALAARENHFRVELPSRAEAEALLAAAADVPPETLPAEAHEIITRTGRLPLALALCGGIVRAGTAWRHVLAALREHDLEFLSADHPAEEQHRNAWIAMDVSLRALPERERERFAELCVFALDGGVPEIAVATLWEHTAGLSPRHSAKLLADFAHRSLVQLSRQGTSAGTAESATPAAIALHDLLHNFAEGMAIKCHGTLAGLHRVLLDAYRGRCSDGWPSGPDDGYFLQKLGTHLLAADELDQAVELLDGLAWLEAKCKAGLVFELLRDYQDIIGALPEAQQLLEEGRRQRARLAQWGEAFTEYSRQWSRRRDREAQTGAPVDEPEPKLPEPPPTCRMWTEEEIAAECRRLVERPTRLDRLHAFEGFVRAQCYPLLEHGRREGFVAQHALAIYPSGPVHAAAEARLAKCRAPVFRRRWPPGSVTNPKPALLSTLEGHTGLVADVSITPDGRRAVSGGDNVLRVWDLESGACLRTLEGHSDLVHGVSVTANGRRAISGSSDSTLRVWDLESGACLRILRGHSDRVWDVSVTPDGRRAVSRSNDKTLRVWDLDRGACLRTLEGHSGQIYGATVTPDGRHAASISEDKTLRVWDLDSGACLHILESGSGFSAVSVTFDGRRAVSGSGDTTLQVWDLESGACLHTLKGHSSYINGVSVTPDGRRAVSCSSKTLRVWDLDSGACLRTLDLHIDEADGVSITSDGRRAVTSRYDNCLRVWDLESGACLHTLGHSKDIWKVGVTPDGRRAVSASSDRTLRLWDLDNGVCLRTLKGHSSFITDVSVTPDGRRAASCSGGDHTLRVWDLESGACLHTLEGHSFGATMSVSVTPDGRHAVSGGGDHTLRVWDLESGACLHTLEGHRAPIMSVSVTPDGRRAISGTWVWQSQEIGHVTSVQLWDLESGACLRGLEGHRDSVNSVSVTPDGQRAVSGSADKTLRLWDLESGACLRILEGHSKGVLCVSVTPDGRRAVSGGWDKTLRVWDLESGACLRTLKGHSNHITGVSVTPDGRRAVSGTFDKTLRLWDLESGECLGLYAAAAAIRSVALSGRNNRTCVGTRAGEVVLLELHGIESGPAILTCTSTGNTRCAACGSEFQVRDMVIAAIRSLCAHLTRDLSPCLDLPESAFSDPRLLSRCPHCDAPMRLNPFLVDVAVLNFEEALRVPALTEDRSTTLQLTISAGATAGLLGDFHSAADYFERAIAMARKLGNRGQEAVALFDWADACHFAGDAKSAASGYTQALAMNNETVDTKCLLGLGVLEAEGGKDASARERFSRCAELCRTRLQECETTYVAYTLALALLGSGEAAQALEAFERAVKLDGSLTAVQYAIQDVSLMQRARPTIEGIEPVRKLLAGAHTAAVNIWLPDLGSNQGPAD